MWVRRCLRADSGERVPIGSWWQQNTDICPCDNHSHVSARKYIPSSVQALVTHTLTHTDTLAQMNRDPFANFLINSFVRLLKRMRNSINFIKWNNNVSNQNKWIHKTTSLLFIGKKKTHTHSPNLVWCFPIPRGWPVNPVYTKTCRVKISSALWWFWCITAKAALPWSSVGRTNIWQHIRCCIMEIHAKNWK